jgi:hypothetical protein
MSTAADAAREQLRAFYLSPMDALTDVLVLMERARTTWATKDDDAPDLIMAINIVSDLLDC